MKTIQSQKFFLYLSTVFSITLPKTNVAPQNWWLEDVFPIVPFQVRTVSFREGKFKSQTNPIISKSNKSKSWHLSNHPIIISKKRCEGWRTSVLTSQQTSNVTHRKRFGDTVYVVWNRHDMITWGVQLASLGYEIPNLKLKIPGQIGKKILGGSPLQSPPFWGDLGWGRYNLPRYIYCLLYEIILYSFKFNTELWQMEDYIDW